MLTIVNRTNRGHISGRGRSGFTLLEVMIVMGLVGVFIAATMPNFRKVIPEMKVDKAATKLATDLRMAQQRAISEMVVVRFRPEINGDRYYAQVKAQDTNISNYWVPNTSDWYLNDSTDEYVTDPLNANENVLMDFTDPESKFFGLDISSIIPSYADGETWGFYFSPLGDLRWPLEDITVTISDPGTGYSRSVRVTYPMGKISVLP
jgi:prepilin-type N-terminal cleavage/methylation domain-containing protein